jgi:16S rRNA (guanine527-N7)-methyltransferase
MCAAGSLPPRGTPLLSPVDRRAAFRAGFAVSRETEDRLAVYEAMLREWNQNLALVANSTIDDIWTRHFLDSAQLIPLFHRPDRDIVDLGAGAGFPGLVLAILGLPRVHLIEHNMRKVAFLRAVAARLGLPVTIHAKKIESVSAFSAGAVTARALKPLDPLIGLGRKFLGAEAVAIFPKGRRAQEELTAAEAHWRMKIERFSSLTDPESTILRLSDIHEARQ